MACTIPYLRELPLDEGTILKLEEIDIDIKSRLLSSGLFNPILRDGLKLMLISSNPEIKKKQLELIRELNSEYDLDRTKLKSVIYPDSVKLSDGKVINNVVIIDVRVLEDANLDQPIDIDEDDRRKVLESFLNPPFEPKDVTFEEFVSDNEKAKVLANMLDTLSKKVENFQGNFTQYGKPINSQFSNTVYDKLNLLKFLSNKLKDEELAEQLFDLSSLIVTANNTLNGVKRRFDQTKLKVEELKSVENKDEFLKKQKDIGEFFVELREVQHVLNFLSDFHLTTTKGENTWENRNLYKFEKGIQDIVAKQYPNNTSKQNKEFLTSIFSEAVKGDFTTVVAGLNTKFKQDDIIVSDLFDQVFQVFKDSKRENKSIIATIEESHQIISQLKTESAELQKEYLAEVISKEVNELYTPELVFESDQRVSNYATDSKIKKIIEGLNLPLTVLQIKGVEIEQDNFFDFFRKLLLTRQVPKDSVNEIISIMESNKLNNKKAMFYASKDKIKGLLTLADKDIDITDRMFEQRSQYDDVVLSTTAALVQKELMKGEMENKLSLQNSNKLLKQIGLSISDVKRTEYEEQFQHEIVYLEDDDKLELATPEDIALRNFVELDGINKTDPKLKYKARRGNALVTEYNRGEFTAQKKVFESTLQDRVNKIFDLIEKKQFNEVKDVNYTSFLELSYKAKDGNYYLKDQFNPEVQLEQDIKKSIQGYLRADFYSRNLKSKENAIDTLIQKTTEFKELVSLLNDKGSSYFNYNTNERRLKEGELVQMIDENKFTKTDLLDYVSKGTTLLVKIKEGEDYKFKTIDLTNASWKQLNVVSIFKYSNNLQVPINKNPKWIELSKKLETDENMLKYYEHLLDKYKTGNNKLEGERLRHYLLQVPKTESKTVKERIISGVKSVDTFLEDLKYKEANIEPIMVLNEETGEWVRGSKDGRILESDEPTEFKTKQFLSGEINKRIKPTFTKPIPYEETEKDLFLALHLFDASTTEYSKKRIAEPLVLTLATIFKGDGVLNIQERKANVELFNKTLLQSGKTSSVKTATNSIKALERFMDSFIYDQMIKDYNLAGVSSKQVTNFAKQTINFQLLSGNIIASTGNFLSGQTSNFLLSQGKKFGLSEEVLGSAYKEYWKENGKGTFIKDAAQTDITKQSKISQLILFFDAIKGEMLDLRSQVIPKNLVNKVFSYNTLFLSTSLAEHANQVPLMIAILKGTKVGKTNLYEIIEQKKGEFFEFNWEKAGIDPNDIQTQKQILLKAHTTIESANFSAHGQYAKMSKSEIQGDSLLSMGLVLSNWIYPFLKTRYGKADFNRFAGEFTEDGYQRQFLRNIFLRTNEAVADIRNHLKEDNSLKGYVKAIIRKEGIGAFTFGLFEMVAKQAGFVADRATFSSLSKNSEKLNKWLYGDKEFDDYEKKRIALVRASSELTFFVGATLLGLYLHTLHDEDDEEVGNMIKALELFTARYANDTGQFLFASSPSSAIDFTLRKSKDPFAIARALDSNLSLFAQIIGFDITEDGVNFNIDDRYAKSGNGYEKGDLKIERKLMKSVFSPLYQVFRFGELDEQLNYTKMLNKNSSNQTQVDEEELEEFADNKELEEFADNKE
jgi:hypothetical protein